MSRRHADLAAIATRAMIEHGLEPEFPPAARAEVAQLGGPAPGDADVADLRSLLWFSIEIGRAHV